MNLLKITALSVLLSMPCTSAYKSEEPASEIQNLIPAGEAETLLLSDDLAETMVNEEAAETETDNEETEGLDIRYLLFLQNFRNSINDAWTPFMEAVSNFATRYLILAVLFIYWALNKREGLYAIASMCLTLAINQIIKLSACVYRPWIRDPRIIPAGDSITTATGHCLSDRILYRTLD
ncbi:MAG: hypothetical protein IKG55_06165 [Solobacterium sp.]|nr:hypothetical protein [Solobacterium sp.]